MRFLKRINAFVFRCGKVATSDPRRVTERFIIRKPTNNTHGYPTLYLRSGGKKKAYLVHRLVAEAYLGSSQLQVNHKDGDKCNNTVENLEYVTCSKNLKHSFQNLGRKSRTQLTDNQYTAIVDMWESGNYLKKDIARIIGIHRSSVGSILKRYKQTGNPKIERQPV